MCVVGESVCVVGECVWWESECVWWESECVWWESVCGCTLAVISIQPPITIVTNISHVVH